MEQPTALFFFLLNLDDIFSRVLPISENGVQRGVRVACAGPCSHLARQTYWRVGVACYTSGTPEPLLCWSWFKHQSGAFYTFLNRYVDCTVLYLLGPICRLYGSMPSIFWILFHTTWRVRAYRHRRSWSLIRFVECYSMSVTSHAR